MFVGKHPTRDSWEHVGAPKRALHGGSCFPTNTWEPPLKLTSLVRVLVSGWKMCNSNKGMGGMENSVVLFKPRIHLFVCSYPCVSNSLVRDDWLMYKHQSTALVQTRLDRGSLLFTSIVSTCVSNTFGMWILVCVHASVSNTAFQTRLDFGSLLCTSISLHPCLEHVLIMVACLFTLPPAPK